MNNLSVYSKKNIQDSLAEAQQRAERDPARPMFHFRSPAQWMNDPNGPIYYQGWYHLFYQFNPYGDEWGSIHWGHARSRDLVRWEHLPIAIHPDEKEEAHCASGCAWLNTEGTPLIFYTSCCGDFETQPFQQRIRIGNRDLLNWEARPENPLFGERAWEGIGVKQNWRDPFIFQEAGRTFLILGAETEDAWRIPIFEADDPTCLSWSYRGVLYEVSKAERPANFLFECPNLVQFGERWLLIHAPMVEPLEYLVGSLDLENLTFHPQQQGVLDRGLEDETGFYATNMFFDPDGQCILLGWIRGFPTGKGWNGCHSLPRVLSLGKDGRPRQHPLPALETLREDHIASEAIQLNNESRFLEEIRGAQLEILIEFASGDAEAFGLRLGCGKDATGGTAIECRDGKVFVDGRQAAFDLAKGAALTLHIFLDHSVLEVFINAGQACQTRVIDASPDEQGAVVFAQGGSAIVTRLDAWALQAIW